MNKSVIALLVATITVITVTTAVIILGPSIKPDQDKNPRGLIPPTSQNKPPCGPPECPDTQTPLPDSAVIPTIFDPDEVKNAVKTNTIIIDNCQGTPKSVNIMTGESITFENYDNSSHKIYKGTEGVKQLLTDLEPNETRRVENVSPLPESNVAPLYCEWLSPEYNFLVNVPFAYIIFDQ